MPLQGQAASEQDFAVALAAAEPAVAALIEAQEWLVQQAQVCSPIGDT